MSDWHTFDVRVYFEDTDAQGVVYFANYLKFMERGRTEWLRDLGIQQDELIDDHGICFALTESDARFHRPARFNDRLQVRTRLVEHSRVRFELEQAVGRADGELLCSARCVAACIDATSFRPRRIPADVLATVTASAASNN
ncbi:MAG: tol-pal system-associated acyl-CoA thioesterase [Gammaproteobacteria bacterium]